MLLTPMLLALALCCKPPSPSANPGRNPPGPLRNLDLLAAAAPWLDSACGKVWPAFKVECVHNGAPVSPNQPMNRGGIRIQANDGSQKQRAAHPLRVLIRTNTENARQRNVVGMLTSAAAAASSVSCAASFSASGSSSSTMKSPPDSATSSSAMKSAPSYGSGTRRRWWRLCKVTVVVIKVGSIV